MDNWKETVEETLGRGGALERHLAGFTPRPEQIRFSLAVAAAFENETFLLAEAGTGVGKTFAYLLPAVTWSKHHQEKVVLSTKTKALQEQIVDRDLPQLERALGYKIKYCEAKGRENFLCWHKYQNIIAGKIRLEKDQVPFVEAILGWAESTLSGDRKELKLGQTLMRHWEIVAAERYACQREICQHHEKCFRMKMLKSLAKADLIVTNHAMLLTDLMMDNSILPEYDHLIIDEAHNFNKEMFDQLALRFSHFDFLHQLQRLVVRDRRSKRGYLMHLAANYPEMKSNLDETGALAETLIKSTGELFACFDRCMNREQEYNLVRILDGDDLDSDWLAQALAKYRDDWKPRLEALLARFGPMLDVVENQEALELAAIRDILSEMDEVMFVIMAEKLNLHNSLTWVEFSEGHAAVLCAADVESNQLLDKKLYQHLRTLVMVSATLTVEESFDALLERCGLRSYAEAGRVEMLLEHSPFDYREQAGFYLIDDLGEPSSPGFTQAVIQVLQEIFLAQRGQTMVLFTSRKQLEETAQKMRPLCEAQGLNLLVQHTDGEFASLVNEFSSHPNSILMGVETFWEGVDLKGDMLKYLVIVKLPFRAPSDPYCRAWEKHYLRQGQNSFSRFMLPDAALRFKQGVGRLIRSETDRGAVVVLDNRLVSKSYGRVFRRSIPLQQLLLVPAAKIGSCLDQWG
ncbi:MAG: helicase C-terminal domain-containing protein [Syntrophomonadaceae bacterium]